MKIIITFNVARTIIKSSAKFDIETGGILVGTLSEPITIVAAGEPGSNAVHNAAYFTTDPAADKSCLEQAKSIYGSSIEPVGYWHKHPLGFDKPSGGDVQQAHQLASEFNDQRPVIMGIVNRKPRIITASTTLQLYSIDSKKQLIQHNWRIVAGKSKRIMEVISKAPNRPSTKLTDYWKDKNFQSYLNPVGRDRIKQDIERLRKAHWQVNIGRIKFNNLLIIDIFDGLSKLRFLLPPEFPLNPPTVFSGNGKCFHGLEAISQWNSTVSLLEIAENAASIMHCKNCSKYHLASV